ncbi:MAG TPA: MbnP family protein [Polyangia bacterium]|nr:MbnP family protein [Polyangia bacterium]
MPAACLLAVVMAAGCQGSPGATMLPDAASVTACPEEPAPRWPSGATMQLDIAPLLAGQPLRFEQANTASDGQVVTPLNFRFYVSVVSLTKADGSGTVPAEIVDDKGAVQPFGVHFYSADTPGSDVLRVRAPAGSYSGLAFVLGLDDSCDTGQPSRDPPLDYKSQMTWPPPFGYLFLRYAGQTTAPAAPDGGVPADAAAPDSIPTSIDMGGLPGAELAPVMKVAGALILAAGADTRRTLQLSMDELFKGASIPARVPAAIAPPGPEGGLGENLRQSAPTLPIFGLAP